jgi:hypothetical protein
MLSFGTAVCLRVSCCVMYALSGRARIIRRCAMGAIQCWGDRLLWLLRRRKSGGSCWAQQKNKQVIIKYKIIINRTRLSRKRSRLGRLGMHTQSRLGMHTQSRLGMNLLMTKPFDRWMCLRQRWQRYRGSWMSCGICRGANAIF